MYTCHGSKGNQRWSYDKSTGLLKHEGTGLCMSVAPGNGAGEDVLLKACDTADKGQQWDWDFDEPRKAPEP